MGKLTNTCVYLCLDISFSQDFISCNVHFYLLLFGCQLYPLQTEFFRYSILFYLIDCFYLCYILEWLTNLPPKIKEDWQRHLPLQKIYLEFSHYPFKLTHRGPSWRFSLEDSEVSLLTEMGICNKIKRKIPREMEGRVHSVQPWGPM